jgi:acyl-ACP thioesterase
MKRAWILNSWQIEVYRPPLMGEQVIIGTWPYDFKGFYGYRNYIMKDKEDKVCAVASSLWIYLNTETGHPARIQPEIADAYHMEPKYPMEYAGRKIPVPNALTPKEPFSVVSANIDTNNHVNNSQYILMAEEYLPKHFSVASLRVEYRSAALLGDRIYPKVSCTDNQCFVVLENEEQKIYAILVFTGKQAGKEQLL